MLLRVKGTGQYKIALRGKEELTVEAKRGLLEISSGQWGIRATEPEEVLTVYGVYNTIALSLCAKEYGTRYYEYPYSKGTFRVEVFFGEGYQSLTVSQVNEKGKAFRYTCVANDLLNGYLQLLDDEDLFVDLMRAVLKE